MNKEAYEAGVEQALIDAGLLDVTKQAGVADRAAPLLEKLKALLGSGKELGAQGLESFSGLGPAAQGGIVGGAAGAGGTALGGGDIGDILLGTGLGAGAGAGVGAGASRLGEMLAKLRP